MVTRKLAASGACSACARRSAAIQRALPRSARTIGFRRAGGQVDGAVGGDELLGGGDVFVAGAEDFFDARDGFCAVGERGDGLRTADARNFVMPRKFATARSSSLGLGQTTTMRGTPATCAGMAVIKSVETSDA